MKNAVEEPETYENVRGEDSDPKSRVLPSLAFSRSSPARKRAWICISGILTMPGDSDGWTDRAVTWLHLHTADRAEKFEYAAGALTRRLRQGQRARAIVKMCGYYISAGYEVSFIAHSNGCDLVARVLENFRSASVRSAHLFAPATDRKSFEVALHMGGLRFLHLYGSPNDWALRFARLSHWLLGWAGLGYGSLGLDPVAQSKNLPRTIATEEPSQNHSSWFARGEEFERTMQTILEADGAEAELSRQSRSKIRNPKSEVRNADT